MKKDTKPTGRKEKLISTLERRLVNLQKKRKNEEKEWRTLDAEMAEKEEVIKLQLDGLRRLKKN